MIRLEQVTQDNFKQVIALDIAEEQRRFLETPTILYAIAEVQFHPPFLPYAIYADDTMVGFVIYGCLPEDHAKGWIPLFIIDHHYQGKGYGRAAMQTIISTMRTEIPNCSEIALCFKPDNTVAERLYSSVGFERTNEVDEQGQVTMRLNFAP